MGEINWNLLQPANIPDAFEAGRQIGRQRQAEQALAKAQKSFSGGDYKGASNALFATQPELAMKTANYGQQQQQLQTRQQAGTMLAGGDMKGAGAALAGMGDIEGWSNIDKSQRAQMAAATEYGVQISMGLKKLPPEQRRAAALQQASQSHYAQFLVPQIQQSPDEDFSDQGIDMDIASAIPVLEQMKLADSAAKLDQGERRLDILEYNATKPSSASMPKLEPGYRYKADGSGDAEVIPGSKAADKVAANKLKADNMIGMVKATQSNVLRSIQQAKANLGAGEVGAIGSVMRNVPGTKAHDLQQNIATIVANIGFDKLTQMRAASPTGGALGAVTERELSLLQSTIASLEQSQSEQQFRDNLARVEQQYQRTLVVLQQAYDEDYGGGQGGAAPAPEDPLGIR